MTPHSPRQGVAFLAGALTLAFVLVLPLAFLSFRIGPQAVWLKFRRAYELATGTQKLVLMPESIREELETLNAVVEYAGRTRTAPTHDTILTSPDLRLGWVLKRGARIRCYTLRAANPLNFNPPLVHLPADAQPSPTLLRYLSEQSRLQYSYTVDAEGLRLTLPIVTSENRILIVGDSVPFGVGVNDDATIASALQTMLGSSIRVVNAGVGGYNGDQVAHAADNQSDSSRYKSLVYIACQNDFMVEGLGSYVVQAERTLARIAALSTRFPRGIVVVLVPTIEYAIYDVLLDGGGWPPSMIEGSAELRRTLPSIAARHGLGYIDFGNRIDVYAREEGSIFARFALYADHVHLSPRGNRLLAEAVHPLLFMN